MFSDTFAKHSLFAACLAAFLSAPLRADSDHGSPVIVTDIRFETQVGDGYWPCSYPPFIPDKLCTEEEDGRGYRYRRLQLDFFSGTYGDAGTTWGSEEATVKATYTYNADDSCLGTTEADVHVQRSSSSQSPSSTSTHDTETDASLPGADLSGFLAANIKKTTATHSWTWTDGGYLTGKNKRAYTLSNPIGIQLNNPVDVVPDVGEAYKLPDGRYQATTVIGRFASCVGKYEAILFYKEYPLDGSTPAVEPQEQQLPPEEVEITEDDLPDGKEIELPLPNTECTRTVFVRMELRPKEDNCSPCAGGGGAGAGGAGGGSGGGGGAKGGGTGSSPGGGGDGKDKSSTSVGKDEKGRSQGDLGVTTSGTIADSYSARALTFSPGSADILPGLVRAGDHSIRQVHGREALVDVTPVLSGPATVGFQVAFYPPPAETETPDPVTGLYAIAPGATPFSTVRYEDPDAGNLASGTRLRVTREVAGAAPKVSEYASTSNGYSLTQGGGLVRTVYTTTHSGLDTTEKEERFSPATATVPDHVGWTITRAFPFGRRVVEESRGTGSARVWTTFAYDETSASPTYGLLLSKISSDGAWERYEYTSRKLAATVSPLGDAAPATTDPLQLRREEKVRTDLTTSAYGAGRLTTTIQYVGGVEVERHHRFERTETPLVNVGGMQYLTEHEISVRAKAPGSALAWDDSANEFSHRYTILVGSHEDLPALEVAADGSVVLFRYRDFTIGETALWETERWAGVPNVPVTATATPTDIVAGTRTQTITTSDRRLLSEETTDVATDLVLSSFIYTDHDFAGRPLTVVHLDGSEEIRAYNPCCGQLTSVSHRGINTTYGYDALGRREWEKVEAGSGGSLQTLSHLRFTYDSTGRVLTRTRVPTSGADQLIRRDVYDDAGRLLSSAAPGSLATDPTLTRVTTYGTTYDSGTGRTTRTVTLPGGATEITLTDRAGRTLRRTGTAVAPVRYDYGTATLTDAAQWGLSTATPLPFTREIKLDAAGADTAETVTTTSDFLGRTIKTVYGDAAAARSFYDLAGRLVRQTDPDGVQTLHAFTPATATAGQIQVTALDLDRDGVIDYDGTDRITRQTTLVGTRTSGTTYTVQRATTEVWQTDASATATTVSVTEATPDGLRSWQTAYGLTTTSVTTYDSTTGQRTDTVTLADATSRVRVSVGDRLVSDTRKDSAGSAVTFVAYGYDAHGRPNVVSALQAAGSSLPAPGSPLVTTTTYYADDQPHTVTTPDPDTARTGPGYDPQTTTHAYDAAGRVVTVTHPDTTQTFTTYWPTGAVKRTWGSRTYPSEYAYDAQGRLKTLTTWQNFATTTTTGAAVTTWNYSPTRGWLLNKRHTDATGPDYDYWPSGRLKTRDWARSVSGTRLRTSYVYNDAGDLATIDYADTTPDVVHTYDRLGRLKTTTDAAGLLTRTYQNGRLDDETYAAGTAIHSGRALTRTQDAYGRPATLGATSLTSTTYGYDNAGRLGTITQGVRVATLGYKPLVGSHQSTAITVSSLARAAVTRTTDALGRVGRIDTTNGTTIPALHARRDYTYDSANQRTEVVHEDALRWAYGYDPLGQVSSARKKNASAVLLPGYDHAYAYDTIGNRVSTTTNGRQATYAPDLRNQYVTRGVPPAFDVLGSAPLDVNVVVGDGVSARDGTGFHRAITVSNAAAPVFESVAILAARPGTPDQVATETRTAFVARTPESYTHDLDGNLTQDGRWTYVWDAENRLVEMATRADVATAAPGLARQKLVFVYDAQGRRIRKRVYSWAGGDWSGTPTTDLKFLYDGWNLMAEYNPLGGNVVVRNHVWGLDLSGSAQGAGGVGGLLWTASGAAAHAPGYDANGNVIVWVDLANGSTVSGRRDYGAFGEPLATNGNAASLPFAFSTKYRDSETELYYYGFRYYNPSTGRWLSRDPIGERGGLNLYGMVGNNLIDKWDYLGLWDEHGGYDHTEFERDWSLIDSGPPYLMPGADAITGIPLQCRLVSDPISEGNFLGKLFDSCKCRKICIYNCSRAPIYRLVPGPAIIVEGQTVPTYNWEPTPGIGAHLIKVLRVKGDCGKACPEEQTIYTNPRESTFPVEPWTGQQPGIAGTGTVRG